MEGAYLLSNKVHLNDLIIRWEKDPDNECSVAAVHEILLEDLRPHCNIKGIEIRGYQGVRISSWVESLATFFPCLIKVALHGFDWLYNLPSLGKLLHLKVLELSSMPTLVLKRLPKLKGVWSDDFLRMEGHRKLAAVRSFPRLQRLKIKGCPSMTAVPRCHSLRDLYLVEVHEDFSFISNSTIVESVEPESSKVAPLDFLPHTEYDSSIGSTIYLENLHIDKVRLVNMLFGESLIGIDNLDIPNFHPEIISAAADLFQKHASSIRSLSLHRCHGLKSLCGGGIEHLTNLRSLYIGNSDELDLGEGEEFKYLQNLVGLQLHGLSKLMCLPQGVRHLTSLGTLIISTCKLELLPEWLFCLPLLSFLGYMPVTN